jgi:hypothetical protein
MKGVKISDNEIVRRVSNKGGMDRHTTCPYCGMKVSVGIGEPILHPYCGHVVCVWEAGNRSYIKFNQFKQDNK